MASGIGGSHDTIMVKFSKHQTTSGEVTMAKFDFNIKYEHLTISNLNEYNLTMNV